jgi:serine/threonine protein kinase
MAPEQAQGKAVHVRSDVYSLGAILYESLTGRPPFNAATPLETMRLVIDQVPPSPRALNPTLPRDLETIALHCLAKDPAARYGSAQHLADGWPAFSDVNPFWRDRWVTERAWRWAREIQLLRRSGPCYSQHH